VRLAAHPHRAQLTGINFGTLERVAGSFDGHGNHVFVQSRHGFFDNRQATFATAPNARHLFGGQTVTGT